MFKNVPFFVLNAILSIINRSIMEKLFILPLFLLILTSCSNNKDEIPEVEEKTYYYSINNSEKQLLRLGDIIPLFVGDTFKIYIDPADISMIFTEKSINIEDNGDGVYVCQIVEPSESCVVFKFGNGPEAVYFYFYIHAQQKEPELPANVLYYIIETSTTLHILDENLKEKISEDIEKYIPHYFTLKLIYTTADTGYAERYYKSTDETIIGSFEESDKGINVKWNNEERYLQFRYVGNIGIEEYVMVQDLTAKYQSEYSPEAIREVLLVTTVLRYELKSNK